MIQKYKWMILLVVLFPFSFLSAEGPGIEELLKAALIRDTNLKVLEAEREVQLFGEKLEDYKEGFLFGFGTREEGITLSGPGIDQSGVTINGTPGLSIDLPENHGTKLEAYLPFQVHSESAEIDSYSMDIKMTQSLNRLFGWEKQNLKKGAERESSRIGLECRIFQRRQRVESELLTHLKSLLEAEKGIISNQTLLYEKSTILEFQLQGGTILRDGSIHLSNLMEIRHIKSEIEEAEIDASGEREKITVLTGISIVKVPQFPETGNPVLITADPEELNSVVLSRLEGMKIRAELSDLKAPVPGEWDLSVGGNQGISSPEKRSISVGINGKYNNFSIGLTAGYSLENSFSLGTVFHFSPCSIQKRKIQEKILEKNLYIAYQNTADETQRSRETLGAFSREIRKLENRGKSLLSNTEFLEEYLHEMEGKYTNGLIQEIEILKARDQKKILEMDWQILNLDRYLLNNQIGSQLIEGVKK